MSTLTNPIKLNPTTITIPRSLPPSSYALKLGLTPHLLIKETLTSSSGIKQNGDALFEVTVPVGGVIELEIEVDRDGLGRIGGMEMSIMQEIELEEMIRDTITKAFRRNTAQLAIEEIRPHGNKTSYIIRPLASSADRSSANTALISTYQPIAHLDKIGICLNWCLPINRDKDPDESQSSNTDSTPSSHGIEDVAEVEEDQAVVPGELLWSLAGTEELILDENDDGQLPVWARTQSQQALDQLFRTNMIKRFPLIFDPDLSQYIPSFAKSSTLLHTLTRALALSASHRTNLYLAARPILNSLLAEQDRMTKYKSDQVSNLSRKGKGAKRIKGDTQDEAPESQTSPPESQVASLQEVSKEINVKLLSDAITRMGFADYKARRIRGGKLGYRSIKLNMSDCEPCDQVVSSQTELNRKMHQLHLNYVQDFDDFLDDDENEHHHPTFEVYDDDDLFLDSDDDDDGFLPSEEEDECLETDEEDGRMDGVDVLGYPWPDQMDSGVDDWLDEPDDQYSGGYHRINNFDHQFDNIHHQEPFESVEHPEDQLGDPYHDHLQEHDEFLDSDVEDQPPHHLLVPPPLSSHQHHPRDNDISVIDQHPDHDDIDFLTDDNDFLDEADNPGTTSNHPLPTHTASIPPILSLSHIPAYILPRRPEFSLGQAATIISHQASIQEQEHENDFLESDNDGSEMGIYTADQYLPNPDPEPESEMGIYTADEEFFDSDPELESELGDYTADDQFDIHQDPLETAAEAESEIGVYTADQYFESHQTSSFMSATQSMDGQEGSWDDDEEVVYRIPSVPPVDMRHYQYQYHQEDIDDDLLMSDGEAMSIHSDLPIEPHDHPEHGQAIHLDGDMNRIHLDRPLKQDTLDARGNSFSNDLPFNNVNNEETLDEAMPASPEFIDSDDDLF